MFEASRGRSGVPLMLAGGVLVGLAAGAVVYRPALIERIAVLAAGGNPLADAFAGARRDHPYPESPLAVQLELEAGFTDVDRDGVLAFADALARDLGFWLLAHTGAASVEEAERALWAEPGGADAFAVAWALRLQEANVHARDTQRLSAGVKPEGYRYTHSDELALLLLHVAWRLDLGMDLVRSPKHRYVLWRAPDGAAGGPRGIEPTCFWRVDALGNVVPSDEPSVGRRLTFPPEHYPSGAGGIRNPKPLPAGAYEPVAPAALADDLLVRLALRYGGGIDVLERRLAETPDAAVAQAVYRIRLGAGVAAWERGDGDAVRREAEALRALRGAHGPLLPEAPDEDALWAAAAMANGPSDEGLAAARRVLAHHEAGRTEPLLFARTDAHAVAMWLELEHGRPRLEDWNARVVPLLNRYRDRPDRIAELCRIGRIVLRDADKTVEELVPECRAG